MPSSAPPFKIIFDDERLECPDSRLLIVAVQSALCIATCALTYPDKEIFEDDSTQFPLFVGGTGAVAQLKMIAFDSHAIGFEFNYQLADDEETTCTSTATIKLFPGNDDADSWSTDDELSPDEQYMMHDAEEER